MKLKDAAYIVYGGILDLKIGTTGTLECSECHKLFTPTPDCRVSQNESVCGHWCASCYANIRKEWGEKHADSYADIPASEYDDSGDDSAGLEWADEVSSDDEV